MMQTTQPRHRHHFRIPSGPLFTDAPVGRVDRCAILDPSCRSACVGNLRFSPGVPGGVVQKDSVVPPAFRVGGLLYRFAPRLAMVQTAKPWQRDRKFDNSVTTFLK